MALTFIHAKDKEQEPMYQAQERLYLTRDGQRIVKEGDPEAASLFVAAGGYVPFQLAERFGLRETPAPEPPGTAAREEAPEVVARLEPPATTHRRGPRERKDGV